MARVHLFSSSTQPYNYKQGPENNISQEPVLSDDDIIDNTTISEQPLLDISSFAPLSPEHQLSSTDLTAALLANNNELAHPSSSGKNYYKHRALQID